MDIKAEQNAVNPRVVEMDLGRCCLWWCLNKRPDSLDAVHTRASDATMAYSTIFRALGVLVVVVLCWVTTYQPISNISQPPAQFPTVFDNNVGKWIKNVNYQWGQNDYTFTIDHQCTNQTLINWIVERVDSPWILMGCQANIEDNCPSFVVTSDVRGTLALFAVTIIFTLIFEIIFVWCLLSRMLKCRRCTCDNCYCCGSRCSDIILCGVVLETCLAGIVALAAYYYALRIGVWSDTQLCVPRLGFIDPNFGAADFLPCDTMKGHLADEYIRYSREGAVDSYLEFRFLIDTVVPSCPGIVALGSGNDRYFSVSYKTAPDLHNYLEQIRNNVMDSAIDILKFFLLIGCMGDWYCIWYYYLSKCTDRSDQGKGGGAQNCWSKLSRYCTNLYLALCTCPVNESAADTKNAIVNVALSSRSALPAPSAPLYYSPDRKAELVVVTSHQ